MPLPHALLRLLLALCLALPLAAPAAAQLALPDHNQAILHDRADLLTPQTEADLTARIDGARAETGVAIVLVTLPSAQPYGFDAVEPFATALFNHWGIGDAARDDGILILVLPADREMRVELGSGFPAGYNRVAQSVIDADFLPAFRDGNYEAGIARGTRAVIDEIARPFAAGESAATPGAGIDLERWVPIGFTAIIALVFLAGSGLLRRIVTRFRRCPSCGRRALHLTRNTTIPATRKTSGRGERITDCAACGYRNVVPYTISRRSSGSGGSFGGGSSSGGGATGRW